MKDNLLIIALIVSILGGFSYLGYRWHKAEQRASRWHLEYKTIEYKMAQREILERKRQQLLDSLKESITISTKENEELFKEIDSLSFVIDHRPDF